MNILIILLFNISFSFNGFFCSNKAGYDPLPDGRPEKFVVEYHINGGMRYYSEALYISEDSSYYTVNDGGAISRINFKFNNSELDMLYKIFKDNNFDMIDTYEEKVYDRGGNSIHLRWGKGKYISVSNSGMSFIDKRWLSEWNDIVHFLEKIIAEQVDLQKKEYELMLDKTLFGKEIYIYTDSEQIVPKTTLKPENENDLFILKKAMLIPGMHRLTVNLDKHYDNLRIDSDSTKGILLKIENDTLKYDFINR